jgi:hypothetical protein
VSPRRPKGLRADPERTQQPAEVTWGHCMRCGFVVRVSGPMLHHVGLHHEAIITVHGFSGPFGASASNRRARRCETAFWAHPAAPSSSAGRHPHRVHTMRGPNLSRRPPTANSQIDLSGYLTLAQAHSCASCLGACMSAKSWRFDSIKNTRSANSKTQSGSTSLEPSTERQRGQNDTDPTLVGKDSANGPQNSVEKRIERMH